jgi:riboflavin kinase/FMN adenylyltransferase
MKLYRSFRNISTIKNSVVSVGMFDGVHVGHSSVINRVIAIAKEKKIKSIIITFSNSPASYFSKDIIDLQITESKEKIELFKKTELDYLFVLEFNEHIANLILSSFINEILISVFKVNYIVFGYDNHFGKNREGTYEYINENFKDIKAELIIASKEDKKTISSTRIKEAILNGDIINSNKLLGHTFTISGKVVKGMQLGRKLGFPTANIAYDSLEKIIPKNGVYYTITKIKDKEHVSITNIGTKPSVQKSSTISIETHILDYKQSIYGQNISIIFYDRIRNEIKFNKIQDLIDQITKDIEIVRKLNSLQITTLSH